MAAGKAPEQVANAAIVSGVAGRYAVALFELARDAGALEAVEADLALLDRILSENKDLGAAVASPLLSREQRARVFAVVGDAVKSANGKGFHKLTENFLGVLAENGRAGSLAAIASAFRTLLAQERGEVSAEVTSAVPLTDNQRAALGARLRELVGRDVTLDARVDPSLLGGLVVKIGSCMIDSSLRTKLNNLKVAMKEVG